MFKHFLNEIDLYYCYCLFQKCLNQNYNIYSTGQHLIITIITQRFPKLRNTYIFETQYISWVLCISRHIDTLFTSLV
jgi:hypothetical protein